MSRVTYTQLTVTAEQEALRVAHQVELIGEADEGVGVDAAPSGTYGFTFSPALHNAPMFRTRRFRSYETHKAADGGIWLIGFASAADAVRLADALETFELRLQPEPEPDADVFVAVPYTRLRKHHQYSVRNEHGIGVTITR